jgi:hypothetical protein
MEADKEGEIQVSHHLLHLQYGKGEIDYPVSLPSSALNSRRPNGLGIWPSFLYLSKSSFLRAIRSDEIASGVAPHAYKMSHQLDGWLRIVGTVQYNKLFSIYFLPINFPHHHNIFLIWFGNQLSPTQRS